MEETVNEDWEIEDCDLVKYCHKIENEMLDITEKPTKQWKMMQGVEKETDLCIICYEKECTILFKPCRHLVTCGSCASHLKRCPLCNSDINTSIVGVSSAYNISSSVFKKSILFGQAIITADEQDIFNAPIQNILNSINEMNEEDRFYMWFPNFCHRIPPGDHLQFPPDVTGVIVLEGLHQFGLCQVQSYPLGLLLIKLKGYARQSLILQSFFTKSDLKNNLCQLLWFSQRDEIEFGNYCNKQVGFSWSYLMFKARTLIDNCNTNNQLICPNQYEIINDTASFCSTVQEWIRKSEMLTEMSYGPILENVDFRRLTHVERLWLTIHVHCRIGRKSLLHRQLLNLSLDCMQITTEPIDPHFVVERLTHDVAVKLASLAAQNDTTCQLLQAWNDNLSRYNVSKSAYKKLIGEQIDIIRHQYSNFDIYIGHEIDSTIRQSIESAPVNPFDCEGVVKWCECVNNEIKHKYSPLSIYGNIFSDIRCLERINGSFILYDLMEHSINSFCNEVYTIMKEKGCKETLTTPLYKTMYYKVVSGNMSCVSKPPNLITSSSVGFSKMNASYDSLKSTQQKILEASVTRTPIWYSHIGGLRTFYRLTPDLREGRKLCDILRQDMYPSHGKNAYTHEIVNYRMHISTVLLDIDLKPAKCAIKVSVQSFIEDLIILVEKILDKCKLNGKCVHYIFQSDTEEKDIIQYGQKYGFHHHIRLPSDTVLTVTACKQLIDILNDARFMFPKTLGLPVINANNYIFDTAIYAERSFHSIRGPFQSKYDNSSKLNCIYRSDNKELDDIPLFHKLVHSPHVDEKSGKHIISGRIIDKLTNIKLIRDEIFLKHVGEASINKYAKRQCSRSITGIMEQVNKRCILFTEKYTKNDIHKLERITNDLWNKSKFEVVKRMSVSKPDEGVYTAQEIELVKNIGFKHNVCNNTLSMTIGPSFKIPFCLMRAHHNPVTSTIGWVGYDKDMIRLGLFVHCFKESCKGKHFMPDGHMIFTFPFYAPHIQKKVHDYVKDVRMNDPQLFRISSNTEENQVTVLYINTNDTGFDQYLPRLSSIHQLYAFVDDLFSHVMMCITTTMEYMIVLKPHDIGIHKRYEVFLHLKDPIPLLKFVHTNKKISDWLYGTIHNILKTENPNL